MSKKEAINHSEIATILVDIKQELSEIRQDISVLKQDVGVLKQDVEGLKHEMQSTNQRLGNLEDKVGAMHDEMRRGFSAYGEMFQAHMTTHDTEHTLFGQRLLALERN